MKKLAGITLLIIGSIILLVHFGHIIFWVLLGTIAYMGVKKLKHAKNKEENRIAYLLLGIAILLCLVSSPFFVGLIIGAGLLYLGWQLINKPSQPLYNTTPENKHLFDNSFDTEWKAFVDKNKDN